MKRCVFVACLLALYTARLCTGQDSKSCDDASSQVSCDACIAASYRCTWCPYLPGDRELFDNQRCRLDSAPCPVNLTEDNPQPSNVIVKDEPLSTEASFDSIQVSPQNVTMHLRKGLPSKFNMTFRSLRNAPLDVYILLDLSSSLSRVLRVLKKDLAIIANSLVNISTDYRMGFGSFVDKNTRPYALSNYMINDTTFNNPSGEIICRAFGECVPTYSFRNSQPLSNDVTEIANSINQYANLSANVDAPEGGLDALLQVAVCTNETGWRPNALHMAFVISDQGYHLAGDGRIAGIVKPNDGLCHLEVGKSQLLEYTHGLLQDYPSVFQVRDALVSNLIVPIFTLNFDSPFLRETYGQLVKDLSSTKAQFIIFASSSTDEIIRVIRESYEETVLAIRVIEPNVDGYKFKIRPVQGCNMSMTDDSCILQFDEEVVFEVTVTLENCSLAKAQSVQLLGPPFSFTTIDLQPLCQCNCSREEPVKNSALCSGKGNLQCGQCECGLFFGETCECNEAVDECPISRVFGSCSGRGRCSSCGECQCFNETYFGDACECMSDSCPDQCNDNGECLCEDPPKCVCDVDPRSGFKFFQNSIGDVGNCLCNPVGCYNPSFPKELCHNTMTNENGTQNCRCSTAEDTPRAICLCPGNFVPINNTCAPQSSFCVDKVSCARCAIGDTVDRSCTPCDIGRFIELSNDEEPPEGFNLECFVEFSSCNYTFSYKQSDVAGSVYFDRRCGTTALPWIIAGSLVGAIIVIGILILILLKILLLAYDRIEYRKFTKDLACPDFSPHENPLYLNPQQEYQNPLMRSASKRKNQ